MRKNANKYTNPEKQRLEGLSRLTLAVPGAGVKQNLEETFSTGAFYTLPGVKYILQWYPFFAGNVVLS